MKKWLRISLSLFFVVMLFFILFFKVGIGNIANVILKMKLIWLLPFFALFLLTKLLNAVNIKILILAVKKKVSISRLFKYVLVSFAIGKYFPGKFGEASLAWMLKKNDNFELGEGLAISLIDKLTTLAILAGFAAYGIIFVFNLQRIYIAIVCIAVIGAIAFSALIFSERLRGFIRKFILRKYAKYFKRFGKSFIHIMTKGLHYVILNFIVTFIQLVIAFYSGVFLFKAFGVDVSVLYIIIVGSILMMIQFFPFPYNGLGVREISGTYLYYLSGIPLAISADYMIFDSAFRYVVFFLFYLAWQKYL